MGKGKGARSERYKRVNTLLFNKWKATGNVKYRNILVMLNKGLVEETIQSCKVRTSDIQDARNAAYVGFLHALDKFDPETSSLSTFVMPAIWWTVTNFISRNNLFGPRSNNAWFYARRVTDIVGRLKGTGKESDIPAISEMYKEIYGRKPPFSVSAVLDITNDKCKCITNNDRCLGQVTSSQQTPFEVLLEKDNLVNAKKLLHKFVLCMPKKYAEIEDMLLAGMSVSEISRAFHKTNKNIYLMFRKAREKLLAQ